MDRNVQEFIAVRDKDREVTDQRGVSMRGCTILLTCGWLLFMPTPTKSTPEGAIDATIRPLSEWTFEGGFDTAKECNDYKSNLIQAAKTKQNKLMGTIYLNSKCVPTDAIGFKMK